MRSPEGPRPERLFTLFRDLVKIDSESGKERRVAEYITRFCAELGLDVCEDSAGEATGGECGNLVIRVPAAAFSTLPPIILNAHLDTVAPGRGVIPVDSGDRFTSAGDTVLGADDKAGVACILAAVEFLMGSGLDHRAVDVVFTVQEEMGLQGAKHLDMSMIDGKWGVCLDGEGPVGVIVTEAPGNDRLRFKVLGRSAHAGIEPERGKSAIACAADAISAISLGRIDEATTANIGIITGGTATNVVPEEVVVEGEVRSLYEGRLRDRVLAMVGAFRETAARHGCEVEIEVTRDFDHFKIDTSGLAARSLGRAMAACGVEPSFRTSGGGSDANLFNACGLEVVAMGLGLNSVHSREEYVLKSDFIAAARITAALACVGCDGREESG